MLNPKPPSIAAMKYDVVCSMRCATPEEALRNILILVDGSDEVEDVHALQILLQSIKTLAEKGLGRSQ
jgi:hypothetical protein